MVCRPIAPSCVQPSTVVADGDAHWRTPSGPARVTNADVFSASSRKRSSDSSSASSASTSACTSRKADTRPTNAPSASYTGCTIRAHQ